MRGRALVIQSSFSILQTFLFFYHRNPAMLICWTMGQKAFNAAMILLLDAWEKGSETHEWIVQQVYAVFTKLTDNGVHALARHAQERIYAALQQLQARRDEQEHFGKHASRQAIQQMSMSPDTAPLTDILVDTVMGGNTSMYLLEDPGLQSATPQYPTFRSWGWEMGPEGSAHPSNPSRPPSPPQTYPSIPVSQITAAPFPVMPTAPITPYAIGLQPGLAPARQSTAPNAQYTWHPTVDDTMLPTSFAPDYTLQAVQLQQHDVCIQQQIYHPIHGLPLPQEPVRTSQRQQQQQQSFSHLRGLRHSHAPVQAAHMQQQTPLQHQSGGTGARPRSHQRLGTTPKSQRRNR